MKRKPVWQDLNPKAVTNDELFGYINPATREWKDGRELQTLQMYSHAITNSWVHGIAVIFTLEGSMTKKKCQYVRTCMCRQRRYIAISISIRFTGVANKYMCTCIG